MPWIPELFSAPVLDRIRRDAADARAVEPVPYFDGVRSGDTKAPVAVAADRNDDGRIIELRVYWSMWPLTGEHQHRAPLLGSDPDLREPDVVGIRLEHCALTDDGRACALEYNIVRWGRTELSPEAGVAVFVRGSSGKLASARLYDDADPPLGGKS